MRSPFKRLLSMCLCCALAFVLFPAPRAEAVYAPLSDIFYSVKDGTVTITGCSQSVKRHLKIPDTIEELPVTEIAEYAFDFHPDLTHITLGNHVTTIGSYAFFRSGLLEITIPASVTYIGQQSLDGIPELKSVVFLGDPPEFHQLAFGKVTDHRDPFAFAYSDFKATVYYPLHNPKWTSDVMKNYGAYEVVSWVGIHTRDNETPITAPTCTTEGSSSYTCSICGEVEIGTTPALGHSWDEGTQVAAPTCTTSGTVKYTCNTCGEVETASIPLLGHSLDKGTVITAATCTEEGTITNTCTVCGYVVIGTIPATGHQYESGTCTICGTTLTGDINGDNTVDIADVARLYAHVRNTAPLEAPHLQNADTTGDGAVDIVDAARLYAHVKGTKPLA